MRLAFAIALRFLFRSRDDAALRLFTAVSVAGIAASVLLFLAVDAVMGGFSLRLREILAGFDAPLTLEVASKDAERLGGELRRFGEKHPEFGLRAVLSREFYGLLGQGGAQPLGIKARVVGADFFASRRGRIPVSWSDGYDEKTFLASADAVIVGEDIFKSLPFPYGDEPVQIIHPSADLGPDGELEPRVKSFVVAGIIATGYYDIDRLYVFVPEKSLSGFADPALMSASWHVEPAGILRTEAAAAAWRNEHPGSEATLRTWLEKNDALFRAMALEKIVFSALFALLVLIACLNLAAVIRIFGISKLKDGAVLRALGADAAALRRVYGALGILLGGAGGLIGAALGSALVLYFQSRGIALPETYGLGELPLSWNAGSALGALFLAPVAAWLVAEIPARRVVNEAVVDVLRWA